MKEEKIKTVFFDFGGVLAEEGFREGLKAIGEKNGLDPDDFYVAANELIHLTGYLTGKSTEGAYWDAVREKTGVRGSDRELREEILRRFVLRAPVLERARQLRSRGYFVAILSDQTNWLGEINEKTPFCHYFDYVFNSFIIGKSKRDPSVFGDVCLAVGCEPGEVLFIDDNEDNVARASSAGLKTIHFRTVADFEKEIGDILAPLANELKS